MGAQIIFPESGCGLGHVTSTIFGIRSNKSLLCGSTRPRRRRLEAFTTDSKIIRLISRRVAIFPAARQIFDGDCDAANRDPGDDVVHMLFHAAAESAVRDLTVSPWVICVLIS